MSEQKTVASKTGSKALSNAQRAKKDEFYTQLNDISIELKHYRKQLRGKVILCNCDDPYESNFFRYFALNFGELELKKLIAVSFDKSSIVGNQLPLNDIEGLKPEGREPYAIEVNEVPDYNNDGAIDLADVEYLLKHDANSVRPLDGDGEYAGGDFRSTECIDYLKQADVVVTNPPFSLFRDYVAQLIEYDKKFLIIGSINAVTYKEIFPLIMDNKVWLGQTIHSGDREFRVPENYPLNAAGIRVDDGGKKYIRVKGIRWFTNMDVPLRHLGIPLYKKYTKSEFPEYDNFDAINVGKTAEIPANYEGMMGVPITFLDKYNPDQFEIVGITKTWFGLASKKYPKQIQVSADGRTSEVSKLNDGASLKVASPPESKTYYKVGNDCFVQTYPRILVRRKEAIN